MLTYSLVLKNKIFFSIVSYISPVKAFKTFLSVSKEDSWEFKSARRHIKQPLFKGPGERGHIVAGHIVAYDVSFAAQTGQHLLRTKNVSEQNQKHFLFPGHKICVRNKCCARG